MTKEDYREAEDNFVGYISHTDLAATCTKFYEDAFPTYTASTTIGAETYYRCGAMKAKLGTRVDEGEFNAYWDKFGGKMLTQDQLRVILASESPMGDV